MFRAFLNYTRDDCEQMSISEYIDSIIMLKEVLKLIHAPFQKTDE